MNPKKGKFVFDRKKWATIAWMPVLNKSEFEWWPPVTVVRGHPSSINLIQSALRDREASLFNGKLQWKGQEKSRSIVFLRKIICHLVVLGLLLYFCDRCQMEETPRSRKHLFRTD
jgi:hypothetical protein